MRLGPILVPSAIVVAVGMIVAAESGWLDGGGAVPSFTVHGDAAIHGVPPVTVADGAGTNTVVGRSVDKGGEAPPSTPPAPTLGSGGARLDDDAAPVTLSTDQTAATAPGALQQARDEAAKAKQDVFEVTQASIAAQHASEAEFEREKAELSEQIAQMRAKIDATPAPPAGSDAAEAKAATAMAELADARERENALRAKLAAAQAGVSGDAARAEAADKVATAERALAEAQGRARDLEGKVAALESETAAGRKATADLAGAESARAVAEKRAKDFEREVAALQTELADVKATSDTSLAAARADAQVKTTAAADKVAAVERSLADAQARAKAQDDRVAALQDELTASKSAATLFVAKAGSADKLKADLDAAQQREDALKGRVATLQAGADEAAQAREEKASAVRKVAALQRQLEDSRLREGDLGARLAGLQGEAAERDARAKQARTAADEAAALHQQLAASQGRERDLGDRLAALQGKAEAKPDARISEGKASDARTVASLQDDLAGARRGQDTLRRENNVLQRELAQERASAKLINEKLAALQVGMGEPASPAAPGYPRRERVKNSGSEHRRLVRQLDALRREQMHQELQALKVEAAALGRPRRGRLPPSADVAEQGARFVTVQPSTDMHLSPAERRAARHRERQARERDAAVTPPPRSARGAEHFSALRQSPDGDDAKAVIAQSDDLIRSGNIDQARQLLRQRGGAAATRALADTYNPLTNSQYGAIGVDSDADKASFLYQQAARAAH